MDFVEWYGYFKSMEGKNSNLKNLFTRRWEKQSWSIPGDLKRSFLEREALKTNKEFFRYFSTWKSADVRILVSEL